MDVQRALAAVAEPTRYRILLLLAKAPRTVGEIATAIDALQPQTTKHLQALEQAGVITMYPLGRRRVAAVNRDAMAVLSDQFARFSESARTEDVLPAYAAAIAAESANPGHHRTLQFDRTFSAPRPRVWAAWTDPALLRRWWAPPYFEVVDLSFSAVEAAPLSLTLREADGTEYRSGGSVLAVTPEEQLVVEQYPFGADGRPAFVYTVDARFADDGTRTRVEVVVATSGGSRETASIIAGLEPGWGQLLDNLSELLDEESS